MTAAAAAIKCYAMSATGSHNKRQNDVDVKRTKANNNPRKAITVTAANDSRSNYENDKKRVQLSGV